MIDVPAGFVDASLAAPDLSGSARVRLTAWEARASGSGDARAVLVSACFDVTPGGWAPDGDAIARAKLQETIAGTAARAIGFGDLAAIDTRDDAHATLRTYEGQDRLGTTRLVARSSSPGAVSRKAYRRSRNSRVPPPSTGAETPRRRQSSRRRERASEELHAEQAGPLAEQAAADPVALSLAGRGRSRPGRPRARGRRHHGTRRRCRRTRRLRAVDKRSARSNRFHHGQGAAGWQPRIWTA